MPTTQGLTPLEAVNEIRNNNRGQTVLVLQGGGGLGAYQGGVYQAMHEAGIEPDWLIGTSIGAINASLIAGNKVENRLPKLKEFWRRVEYSTFWGGVPCLDRHCRSTLVMDDADERHPRLLRDQYARLAWAPMSRSARITPASIRPSRCGRTLEELVDFSLINQDHPRLTVGAAHLRMSMMRYFDN